MINQCLYSNVLDQGHLLARERLYVDRGRGSHPCFYTRSLTRLAARFRSPPRWCFHRWASGLPAFTSLSGDPRRNLALSMNHNLPSEKEMYFSMLFGMQLILPSTLLMACIGGDCHIPVNCERQYYHFFLNLSATSNYKRYVLHLCTYQCSGVTMVTDWV